MAAILIYVDCIKCRCLTIDKYVNVSLKFITRYFANKQTNEHPHMQVHHHPPFTTASNKKDKLSLMIKNYLLLFKTCIDYEVEHVLQVKTVLIMAFALTEPFLQQNIFCCQDTKTLFYQLMRRNWSVNSQPLSTNNWS